MSPCQSPLALSGSPRRGYDPADYEDAFAANAVAGRFAVADGATEGCFTDLWARLLVGDFVAGSAREAACWPDGLPALQDRWLSEVSARRLPWYAESSVSQGAFRRLPWPRAAKLPSPSGRGAGREGVLPLASRRRGRQLPAAHPRQRPPFARSPWSWVNSSTTFPSWSAPACP